MTPYRTRETRMVKHKGQLVGYVRVSTLDQHTERQPEGMKLVKLFKTASARMDLSPRSPHRLNGVAPCGRNRRQGAVAIRPAQA